MKGFGNVFLFSFLSILKKKSFVVSTIIILAIIAIGMCVPSVINMVRRDDSQESGSQTAQYDDDATYDEESPTFDEQRDKVIAIMDPGGLVFSDRISLGAYLHGYTFVDDIYDIDEVYQKIEDGELEGALITQDRLNIDFLNSPSVNLFDQGIYNQVYAFLETQYRMEVLEGYGIDKDEIQLFFASPSLNFVQVGTPAYAGFVQAVVFLFLIYFSILMCGNMVAVSVAQEKCTRSMEMLITSTKPTTLMFGKIFGVGFAGLMQITSFVAIGALFYIINREAMSGIANLGEMFNIPIANFIYFFIFFIGGYFLYATFYAALGSLVSRVEDLNSAMAPVMLFIIAGFFIAIYGPMYGFSGSLFYKVCSYVPFTAPYVMLTRVFSENIAVWETAISILLLYLSIVLAGFLCAAIYRAGVLMYGTQPKLKDVIKTLRAN